MKKKTAVIAGAGPAGLTAALELLEKADVHPVIFELSAHIGGICRTVEYKGNRMDIGGHRFFSKSDRVVEWWKKMLPLEGAPSKDDLLAEVSYQGRKRTVRLEEDGPDPEKTDRVMLVRSRKSRIFFLRKFFDYPLTLRLRLFLNLGFFRSIRIVLSYVRARLFPIRPEVSLRDFIINRFGRELYLTFFRSYTEKVWGVPCSRIKADWGAQRIKSLSLSKAVLSMIKNIFFRDRSIAQKDVPTSLIERFMYPKFGPGQMWEEAARRVAAAGGEIHMNFRVTRVLTEGRRIAAVEVTNDETGQTRTVACDYFISTMPVKELIGAFSPPAPPAVRETAEDLRYRDFITVGLLLKKMRIRDGGRVLDCPVDNWIYIQERDVKVGRLQIFNNWSPYLVRDPGRVWIGMEYFCDEGDDLWKKTDTEMMDFASSELVRMGMASKDDVLDGTVLRVLKTYPAYFGTYDRFDEIRRFTDAFENLFLIGRNGMHRYNNQDHSMLTAMAAVENIAGGILSKDNLWAVNTEDEYHEEKK